MNIRTTELEAAAKRNAAFSLRRYIGEDGFLAGIGDAIHCIAASDEKWELLVERRADRKQFRLQPPGFYWPTADDPFSVVLF